MGKEFFLLSVDAVQELQGYKVLVYAEILRRANIKTHEYKTTIGELKKNSAGKKISRKEVMETLEYLKQNEIIEWYIKNKKFLRMKLKPGMVGIEGENYVNG